MAVWRCGSVPVGDQSEPPHRHTALLLSPMRGQLDELTLPDLQAQLPEVVVIPVGSTEAHAYHLPYGTDTWRVEAHARRAVALANEQGARVVALPALPYGVNTNFTAYPLTVRLR